MYYSEFRAYCKTQGIAPKNSDFNRKFGELLNIGGKKVGLH